MVLSYSVTGGMAHTKRYMPWSAILLLALHISAAKSVNPNESPVYEIINEQSRIDEVVRPIAGIPYGNPLAGNSLKNARLHAQNQQAMFNAERVRQHRAQLQRWAQMPHVDSYMQAYHDSQEDHQLAVEQQQALGGIGLIEKKQANPQAKPVPKLRHNSPKPDTLKKGVRVIPDVIKITKADAVVRTEKIRNHRSYGSVNYQQHLQPRIQYKTVYVSPAPTYDQGVTIKPNGNVGLSSQKEAQGETKFYTEAVPSNTQYVYPKQYNQMQGYQSAQEIATLNSLLKMNPHEQLTQLNALINVGENTKESVKDDLESPVDLYFYMKDPPAQSVLQHYDQELYEKVPPTYASAYTTEVKDHTPITEQIDDVENPNKDANIQAYGVQTVLATQAPEQPIETTTTKSNNYYKVEVASQTISAGYKPKPKYQYYREESTKHHTQPLKHYLQKEANSETDESQRYFHHNAHHVGVQHLSEDGTGVSAYDDENVSKVSLDDAINANTSVLARKRRSNLETDPFELPPNQEALTEAPIKLKVNNTLPTAEPLIRYPIKRQHKIATFVTTPNFAIGEAIDYNNFQQKRRRPQKSQTKQDDYEYEDDDINEYDEDFTSPDYEYPTPILKPSPLFSVQNRPSNYAPSIGYGQNLDLQGSSTNKYRKRHYPSTYGSVIDHTPVIEHTPIIEHTPVINIKPTYGVPQIPTNYGVPIYGMPVKYGAVNNVIEPFYMLSLSQLKSLLGHQNLNIQPLDVFPVPHSKRPSHSPRKHRRYPRYKQNNVKKHIHKLQKLHLL